VFPLSRFTLSPIFSRAEIAVALALLLLAAALGAFL
jgi:hypothetical protein